MSIFNFGKKNQEKTQKKDVIRTAAVDKAFNPTRYEFSDINNKNDKIVNIDNDGLDIDNDILDTDSDILDIDINKIKNTKPIDAIKDIDFADDLKNDNIDLEILDDLPKIDEKFDLDLKTDFDKNINNTEKLNKNFDKFQESLSNDFNKMLKDDKIDNKLDSLLKDNLPKIKEAKKDTEIKLPIVEIKKDTKTEEKKKVVSEIAIFAMSRRPETAFDLGDDMYIDDGCEIVKFDIYGTQTDLEKFVEEHLDIKYLDISDCREDLDFSILAKLKKLKHLDLSGNRNLENISFLNGMDDLVVLNLGIIAITNLYNFPYLPKLKVLNLKMNRIRNLHGLEKQTDLTDLTLWGTDVDDIEMLKDFKNLRALDFNNCINIKDYNPISDLTKLVYLNFFNLKMSEFSFLKKLKSLVCLLMDGISGMMTDDKLNNLVGLTNMKFLYMKNMNLRDISFLKNMTKMRFLNLTGNFIVDLSPLENMTEMINLNLSNNLSLTDLSPLHKMSKIVKLIMNGMSGLKHDKGLTSTNMIVSDISVVKNMPNLEVIEMNNNSKIKDISHLKYCSKLTEAHFNNCISITDASALMYCRNITDIYFEGDMQLKDFSFVKYLNKLVIMEIKKSGIDALTVSEFNNILYCSVWNLDDTSISNPKFKPNKSTVKAGKTLGKALRKYITEDDYDYNEE